MSVGTFTLWLSCERVQNNKMYIWSLSLVPGTELPWSFLKQAPFHPTWVHINEVTQGWGSAFRIGTGHYKDQVCDWRVGPFSPIPWYLRNSGRGLGIYLFTNGQQLNPLCLCNETLWKSLFVELLGGWVHGGAGQVAHSGTAWKLSITPPLPSSLPMCFFHWSFPELQPS